MRHCFFKKFENLVFALAATSLPVAAADISGVQLWENGPYWAECNLGATKPEDFGHYFYWGDTEGFVRQGGRPGKEKHGINYYCVNWVSSTGVVSKACPFESTLCPTFGKDDNALRTLGFIDEKGNLNAEHDAATVQLGAPWRLPTGGEVYELKKRCDVKWTTYNGVYGCFVRGRGAFASKSIFIPAAGGATGRTLYCPGVYGKCWTSSPWSGDPNSAYHLSFASDEFNSYNNSRCFGRSIRPVRSGDESRAGETKIGRYTWSYTVGGGEATIVSPTGKLYERAIAPEPKGFVDIPSRMGGCPVTSIGDFALCDCSELTSVKIPRVKSIGEWAFSGCDKLKSVRIPSSVIDIGDCVFAECSNLTKIGLEPNNRNFTEIDGILYSKDRKRLLTCPGGVTSVSIPDGTVDIGTNAFRCCLKLKSVKIPSSVKRIRRNAFCGTALTSVVIPPSVDTIGSDAFWCCDKLTDLRISEGVKDICSRSFYQCRGLRSVRIPASVTRIGFGAFEGCTNLTSVTMCGERPTSGDGVFAKCGNLAAICVPAGLKSWDGMTTWQGIPLHYGEKSTQAGFKRK